MEDKQNSSEHFSGLLPPIELNPGNRRDAYPGIGRMARNSDSRKCRR